LLYARPIFSKKLAPPFRHLLVVVAVFDLPGKTENRVFVRSKDIDPFSSPLLHKERPLSSSPVSWLLPIKWFRKFFLILGANHLVLRSLILSS
jgi:hypothetical protein